LIFVYESDNWLVVDKPAGQLVIPGRGSHPVLKTTLEQSHGRLWVVHRLDLPVSGVLLFARNAEAHRAASMAFERREVEKTYQALTGGQGRAATWSWPLRQGKKRVYVHEAGRECVTEATPLRLEERGQLWSLKPRTGRRHQLRVHAMTAGHPIHGDALYGSEIAWQDGIALRAVRLALDLPDLPSELCVDPL